MNRTKHLTQYMKITFNPQILLLAALTCPVPLAQTARAQSWLTVDDFIYDPGYFANAAALTIDPTGNLFVAGNARENPTISWDALIQRSADAGSTWTISDNFGPTASGHYATYFGLASDAAGNLYAVGTQNPEGGTGIYWLVRQSSDSGNTWNTIDYFNTPGVNFYAHGVSTDSAGNVYVAGYSTGANNVNTWTVRKGVNAGGSWSWSTVDSFSPYNYGQAFAVLCHPNGTLFVSGSADVALASKKGTSVVQAWITRRSLDGGRTWSTVDSYSPASGFEGRGLGIDVSGNIYAVGLNTGLVGIGGTRKSADNGNTWTTVDTGTDASGFAHDTYGNLFVVGTTYSSRDGSSIWTVRENPGGTGTWTTVDSYQLAPSKNANPAAVMSDASGHTYVVGTAADASGLSNWIVRKR